MHDDSRTKEANRITWLGLTGNLILTAAKLAAGIFGASAAMVADGLHSFSDLATDFVVLFGIRAGARPADRRHPYGHGRVETFAALIIAAALFLVGFGILFSGLRSIYGVMHGEVLPRPGLIALIMAFLSIALKEWMYQYTVRVGRRINSLAVISNAWHHRSDGLSSIATLIGIGFAYSLGPAWRVMDPAAAVAVSFFIFWIGFKVGKEAYDELTDSALPPHMVEKIKEVCLMVPAVSAPHSIKTRRMGRAVDITMHVKMPPDTPLDAVHNKMDEMERCVKREFGRDTFITIHPEPQGRK